LINPGNQADAKYSPRYSTMKEMWNLLIQQYHSINHMLQQVRKSTFFDFLSTVITEGIQKKNPTDPPRW